jgi:hypothetical protein
MPAGTAVNENAPLVALVTVPGLVQAAPLKAVPESVAVTPLESGVTWPGRLGTETVPPAVPGLMVSVKEPLGAETAGAAVTSTVEVPETV